MCRWRSSSSLCPVSKGGMYVRRCVGGGGSRAVGTRVVYTRFCKMVVANIIRLVTQL